MRSKKPKKIILHFKLRENTPNNRNQKKENVTIKNGRNHNAIIDEILLPNIRRSIVTIRATFYILVVELFAARANHRLYYWFFHGKVSFK
jgi:hypothetical protein